MKDGKVLKSITIEKVENGFTVSIYKEKEQGEAHELMYCEPEKYVAESAEYVMEIVKPCLKY